MVIQVIRPFLYSSFVYSCHFFFSITGWGIDLDYCDIEWFALESNRDHSVIFEIASKYCISDSFVDHDGYSISSKGFLPTVVDIIVKVLHAICQQIWKTQQWPQDWKRSVFIPIPKKGNAKEFSNYGKVALISHASKVMLKIL